MPTEELAPEKTLTLFEHEDELAQLEELISQDGDDGALVDAHEWVQKATIHKREKVARHLQDAKWRLEIGRELLKKRAENAKAFLDARENEIAKHETYFAAGIKAMGADAKGKYPILRGLTTQLRIQKNPDSVNITDASAVPARFKSITVTMPLEDWVAFDVDCRRYQHTVSADKSAIKRAIDSGESVPGAVVKPGEYSLRID